MEIEIKYGVNYYIGQKYKEYEEKICDTLEDLHNEIKEARKINKNIFHIKSYLVLDNEEFREIERYYLEDEE